MSRPSIPDLMKSSIRRRCGYGCVICGKPIIEYHHIHGYSEDVGHIESEITCLCPSHHVMADVTGKALIPVDEVVSADKHPFNLDRGRSTAERVWWSNKQPRIRLGDAMICFPDGESVVAIQIDEVDVVSFRVEDGQVFLNMVLCIGPDIPFLKIHDNELQYISLLDGDEVEFNYEFVGSRFTIWMGKTDLFKCSFSKEEAVFHIETAVIALHGVVIRVLDGSITLFRPEGGTITVGSYGDEGDFFTLNAPIAFSFGKSKVLTQKKAALELAVEQRTLHGSSDKVIISEAEFLAMLDEGSWPPAWSKSLGL